MDKDSDGRISIKELERAMRENRKSLATVLHKAENAISSPRKRVHATDGKIANDFQANFVPLPEVEANSASTVNDAENRSGFDGTEVTGELPAPPSTYF